MACAARVARRLRRRCWRLRRGPVLRRPAACSGAGGWRRRRCSGATAAPTVRAAAPTRAGGCATVLAAAPTVRAAGADGAGGCAADRGGGVGARWRVAAAPTVLAAASTVLAPVPAVSGDRRARLARGRAGDRLRRRRREQEDDRGEADEADAQSPQPHSPASSPSGGLRADRLARRRERRQHRIRTRRSARTRHRLARRSTCAEGNPGSGSRWIESRSWPYAAARAHDARVERRRRRLQPLAIRASPRPHQCTLRRARVPAPAGTVVDLGVIDRQPAASSQFVIARTSSDTRGEAVGYDPTRIVTAAPSGKSRLLSASNGTRPERIRSRDASTSLASAARNVRGHACAKHGRQEHDSRARQPAARGRVSHPRTGRWRLQIEALRRLRRPSRA